MTPVIDAFFSSWPFDPGLLIALGLTASIYLRGWLVLHRRDRQRWSVGQPAAFFGGLAVIFLALASPIEAFSYLFLQVHMVQHLLLMMAAPPLIWLGDPLFPLLLGLPRSIRTYWVSPCFRWPALRRFFGWLSHPIRAWLLYVTATWVWHVPALYEVAVRSDNWHYLQHMTFLTTALIFWFPVVRPYPSRPRWSLWLLIPYLLLADVQNTVLSALLTFSDRAIYPYYGQAPWLNQRSALDDQATAGVIMWVPGSLVFLIPLFCISIRLLFGIESNRRKQHSAIVNPIALSFSGRVSLPLLEVAAKRAPNVVGHWDLLRAPGLGRFLRWRRARLFLQIPFLVGAGALVYDGLAGPDVAPMNIAGVLPWIHWRGLLILGLLVAGNIFCMACPFMAPRMLAKWLFPKQYAWPRRLQNKWLAVILLVLFLWAYEVYSLWDSPWWTAWIIIGYFVGALVVDGFFRGAAFCKYVCPIGQFNFVQSLMSPWEVKARDPKICAQCKTKDCIRGRPATTDSPSTPAVRGCELNLFVPRKSSNMDCTFCLDCIHACPHDNIGIVSGTLTAELWHDPVRSGIGRFGRRSDLAALVLLLVFGAFTNAAGMVGPIVDAQDWLRQQWGQQTPYWAITAYYLSALLVLPLLTVGIASALSRWWGGLTTSCLETATLYIYALAPLGFAMWLSHYSFHLLSSYDAAVPAMQRFVNDLGGTAGSPDWTCSCCRPVANWILRLEITFLGVGLLFSLYTGYRIAFASSNSTRAVKSLAPWTVLIVVLYAVGVWIVLQPMQMRGVMTMAG